MSRSGSLFTLFLLLVLLLAACGGDVVDPEEEVPPAEEPAEPVDEEVEQPEPAEEEPAEEVAESGDVITLEFWHAMGGGLGETIDELVTRYNESQDEIVVNSTYQGTYDDTYNALLAAFDAGTEPHIVQNFDLAAQTMFDTGRLVATHELMEADNYDPEIFVPAVRAYYSDEEGMVGMGFNSSTPIVYYNADLFEEAGLEPPPEDWDFSTFLDYCEAIQENTDTEFCVAFGTVGWYFEQILANSGSFYFNNDNGRTARATEVRFNEEQGVETFDFLTGMIVDGQAPNLGNTWTETDSVFFAEQAAMLFDSTAGAPGVEEGAEFEVSTAFIPHSDSSERNGVAIGGAALWLLDSGDDAENAAAWEFMKYMAEPEQQVTWHTETGYFPVRNDLVDNPELQEFWEESPNLRTAIEQLATTRTELDDGSPNYAVLGGRAGPFPAIRQLIVEAYSRVIDDGLTPQEALDEAAEKANRELQDYNEFFDTE